MFKNVFTFALASSSSCSLMVSSKEVAHFTVFYSRVLSQFSGAQLTFPHPSFYFIYNNYLYTLFYFFYHPHAEDERNVIWIRGKVTGDVYVRHFFIDFKVIWRHSWKINYLEPTRKCASEIMQQRDQYFSSNNSIAIQKLCFAVFT